MYRGGLGEELMVRYLLYSVQALKQPLTEVSPSKEKKRLLELFQRHRLVCPVSSS